MEVALVVDEHEHRQRLRDKRPDSEVERQIQGALEDPSSDLVSRIRAHLEEYLAKRPQTIRIDTTGIGEDATYLRLLNAVDPVFRRGVEA